MVVASLKFLTEMESASVPSHEHSSTTWSNANSSSVRAKCDPAWDHLTEELKNGKCSYRYIHCGKVYEGKGINRMKGHLAGIKGDVVACTASYDPGYRGRNYHALRAPLLREAKREVQLIVDSHRSYWADTGCTIMANGWIDTRHRTLINFLVYCPKGIIFIRSFDASDLVKNAINLSNLFDEIVDWVGPANIVHLVTDNAANYVAVGRILCGKYRNISWSPCADYCLNLILKEIGKMDHVNKLAKCASKITVFIYNHVALQAWLRTRKNWTEIVRLGPIRFATTFISLGSLKEHKHDLQALVTSKFYVESRYVKDKKAKAVVKIILDNQFWNDCHVILHIVSPLIRLLRIVDSDEKPAMGYVYDGMYKAIDGIKKNFKDKKRLREPYVNIIKDRWDT
ncbi:uncharacterized protein LOC142632555 [Castanea sativa]|uniref:uncharacterized protein LOC142632555 n=1 Tax=Castanea sativa TaxID=21020 RepID=UPI003F64F4FF